MVEVINRQVIEKIVESDEIKAVDTLESKKTTKPYKSASKSVKGLVLGLIQKFSNDVKKGKVYTAKELETVFSEALKKFNEFYPNKITKIEIIEGWEKENGDFPIWRNFNNDFVVEIWHKDGKDKKVVSKADLNRMLMAIRKMTIGESYKCYAVAKFLGYEWKEIWKERMDIYFPVYYMPLKIFNELGIIHYGGNKKSIVRLK